MFNNPFLKKDPLVEAVNKARAEGDMRRAAEALVNEEFGVYSRNAVIRENLAAYDARIEETYKALKEGKKPNDGNLANNYPPYDKVTRGDVVAGRLGKDQMGGKKKMEEGTMTGIKLKANKGEEGLDVNYRGRKLGTINKAHRGEWGTDDNPGVGSKKDAIASLRSDEAGYLRSKRAKKMEEDIDEGTMTGITTKNTKKGAHVSYRGREIGKVSPYQHMDSSGKLTGHTKWAATDKSGDDVVGSRKKEHAIADLRSMEASRLRDKRAKKMEEGMAAPNDPSYQGSGDVTTSAPKHVRPSNPERIKNMKDPRDSSVQGSGDVTSGGKPASIREAVLAKIRSKHMNEENIQELSAFGSAFAAARKAGQSNFSFGGKSYNTKMDNGPQGAPGLKGPGAGTGPVARVRDLSAPTPPSRPTTMPAPSSSAPSPQGAPGLRGPGGWPSSTSASSAPKAPVTPVEPGGSSNPPTSSGDVTSYAKPSVDNQRSMATTQDAGTPKPSARLQRIGESVDVGDNKYRIV